MQYLYKDDRYNFMDTETYDQISLSSDEVGDARDFLKENTEVDILFIDGSPVTVELPNSSSSRSSSWSGIAATSVRGKTGHARNGR